MLTPRDLKPGDSLFFSTPPPEFQWTPLRTLYVVLHAEHTIKIRDPGGGGTWVFFGWVCAARDSKLAPRSKKKSPKIDTPF